MGTGKMLVHYSRSSIIIKYLPITYETSFSKLNFYRSNTPNNIWLRYMKLKMFVVIQKDKKLKKLERSNI